MDYIKLIKNFEYWDVVLTIIGVYLFYQVLVFSFGTTHPIDVVVSESMLPTLKPGDLIICMKGEPELNDIVIYSGFRDYPIIHRIIGVNDTYCRGDNPYRIEINNQTCYSIQGDNNPVRDPPVAEDQIMCVVKAKIPYAGYPRYLIFKVFGI